MVYLEFLRALACGHGIGEKITFFFVVIPVRRNVERSDAVYRAHWCAVREGVGVDRLCVALEVSGHDGGACAVGTCGMQVFSMTETGQLRAIQQIHKELVEERSCRHVYIHGGIVCRNVAARPRISGRVAQIFGDGHGECSDHGRANYIGYECTEVIDGNLAGDWVVSLAEQFFSCTSDDDIGTLAADAKREGVECAGEDRGGYSIGVDHILSFFRAKITR